MLEFLSTWRPGEVIALVAVLAGCLMITIIALAGLWHSSRNATQLAEQKRDYLERGLSLEQIERLLRAPAPEATPSNEQEAEAHLAAVLVENEVPASSLQQVMEMFKTVNPTAKQAVSESIEAMLEAGADEAQLLAAVRALCGQRPAKQPVGVA